MSKKKKSKAKLYRAKTKWPQTTTAALHMLNNNEIAVDDMNEILRGLGVSFRIEQKPVSYSNPFEDKCPEEFIDPFAKCPTGHGLLDCGIPPRDHVAIKDGFIVGGPVNSVVHDKEGHNHSGMYVEMTQNDIEYVFEVFGDQLVFINYRGKHYHEPPIISRVKHST